MTAHELLAKGYQQISRKYRHVARLPEGKTGLQALMEVDPLLAKRMLDSAESYAKEHYLRVHAKDKLTLSEEEFEAFKKAGG
jgi:hypothetical protein